jgi:hypothetical protein
LPHLPSALLSAHHDQDAWEPGGHKRDYVRQLSACSAEALLRQQPHGLSRFLILPDSLLKIGKPEQLGGDATGKRHLLVDPKCKYTIEALERHAYKQGTSVPDKDSGYDHMSDALRYMISYIWPVKTEFKPLPAQRWGHRIT